MTEFFFRNLHHFKQLTRYVISGGTATAVNLGLLYVFTDLAGIWYLLSAIISFILSFFVSFILQRFWTFGDKRKDRVYKQLMAYFGLSMMNLGLNTALMYFVVDILGVWYLLAQAIISALIALESFLVYKFVIFKVPIGE